jgi:orotate phosphoribosyltransferase-like protein
MLVVLDALRPLVEREQCDLIMPIPTSGFPIAGMLFAVGDAGPLVSFHWRDEQLHAEAKIRSLIEALGHPPRICAIDSVVHTGTSLYVADAMMRARIGCGISAVVSIVNNDLVPVGLTDPIKVSFETSGKFKYLFRVSDLERIWSSRVEEFMLQR